jgi:hypothetical protein
VLRSQTPLTFRSPEPYQKYQKPHCHSFPFQKDVKECTNQSHDTARSHTHDDSLPWTLSLPPAGCKPN